MSVSKTAVDGGARKKRGRKPANYPATWGETINGLSRRADGRWRIIATGQTFVEPDERLAVHRFRNWQARNRPDKLRIPVATTDLDGFGSALTQAKRTEIRINVPLDHTQPIQVDRVMFGEEVWPWLQKLLLERPDIVAEKVGIPEIAYLADLPRPKPSPLLEDIGKLYAAKALITPHEKNKSELFWREFTDIIGVKTVREVTAERASEYLDHVLKADNSPTYAKHRFGKIKTILNFARKRGQSPTDIRQALDACAVLAAPKSMSLDPHPIDPEVFQKLLKLANDQLKAILLLSLNCCMYAAEVADVKWSDVDLEKATLIADRGKTGCTRVAILWPATIAALNKLPRKTDALFIAINGLPHNANTITKAFRKVRHIAELDDVQFCDIRDGSYTAAVEADNVQYEHARALAGHRNGMSDHYVKRRPQLVAPACEAIARTYKIGSA